MNIVHPASAAGRLSAGRVAPRGRRRCRRLARGRAPAGDEPREAARYDGESRASTMAERRQTRQIKVGKVPVGGGAPVSVQSMTTTKTADVEGDARRRSTRSPPPAPTSCAAPATSTRRPRASPASSPARRCRSSPTSTSTRDGARRPRGRGARAAAQPGQPPQARGDQARRLGGARTAASRSASA